MTWARYGVGRYGTFDYGELWSEATTAVEGAVSEAKDCTVFLARDSDMDDDVSQYGTDLTTSGSGGYELSSTRADIDGTGNGRGLCAIFDWDTGQPHTVFIRHGSPSNTSNRTYELEVFSNDKVRLHCDSATVVELDLPNVAATSRRFMVTASTYPNPDATGSADEVVTCVSAYNADVQTWAHASATHAIASGSGYALSIGGRWDGTSLQHPATTMIAARIDNCYVSATEYSEDFGALYDARPSGHETTSAIRREAVRPGSGAFAADEYLGQGNIGFVADAARMNDLRLAGPIIGVVNVPADGDTSLTWLELPTAISSSRHITTLGGFTYGAGYVYCFPVHRGVVRARVRVYVASTVTSGSAQPVTLRALSCSRNPFQGTMIFGVGSTSPSMSRVDATIDVDDGGTGAGKGAWYDLGILRLHTAPDSAQGPIEGISGSTWVALGWRYDGGVPDDQRVAIKAIHLWPVVLSETEPTTVDTGQLVTL